jgi:hypothetical protein
MTAPQKPRGEELTLNTHCITNFRLRAGLHSVVYAVDEIRRLFDKASYAGEQQEPRGRSPKKKLRAPHKARRVSVWQVIENKSHWIFYVRGQVLLTVHLHGVR